MKTCNETCFFFKKFDRNIHKVNKIGSQSANETPKTSTHSSAKKHQKFRKFRDNQHPKNHFKPLYRTPSTEKLSASQLITRKLLRSIKRRQLQRSTASSSNESRNLKRRLSFLRSTRALTKSAIPNDTLEDGEIRSESENSVVSDKSVNKEKTVIIDDDDCICVEPPIEHIVIDDDTPSTSNISQLKRRPAQKKPNNWLTSTPFAHKGWYKSINSEDTFSDYTRFTTSPLGVRKTKAFDTNEVIVLDDSTLTEEKTIMQGNAKKRKSNEMMDDSVILVSETKSQAAPDFIPLSSDDKPSAASLIRNPFTPKKPKITNPLFTKSEKKQLVAYNSNAYNPSAGTPAQSKKRMVIIDGSNVAFNHSLNKEFSVKGLKICIDYFDKMGHEVKAIVPQFRLHRCSDPAEMEALHRAGKIVLTPCKNLPGKSSTSYDDRFVLQLASELDTAVVSNDNYRDLINENPAFKKIIENRVLGFTWCNDIFMVAKDPYGKWGPTLETILNRS